MVLGLAGAEREGSAVGSGEGKRGAFRWHYRLPNLRTVRYVGIARRQGLGV